MDVVGYRYQMWVFKDMEDNMDDLTLGRIGYEAYGNFTGWKTYNGKDMPQWDDLTLNIMRAWQAAGEAIVAHIFSDKDIMEKYML